MSNDPYKLLIDIEAAITEILNDSKIAVASSFGGGLSENALKEQMRNKTGAFGFLSYTGDWQIPETHNGGIRTYPEYSLVFVARDNKGEDNARHCCYEAILRSQALLVHNNLNLDIQPLKLNPVETVIVEQYDKSNKIYQNYAGFGMSIQTAVEIYKDITASCDELKSFIVKPGDFLEVSITAQT